MSPYIPVQVHFPGEMYSEPMQFIALPREGESVRIYPTGRYGRMQGLFTIVLIEHAPMCAPHHSPAIHMHLARAMNG